MADTVIVKGAGNLCRFSLTPARKPDYDGSIEAITHSKENMRAPCLSSTHKFISGLQRHRKSLTLKKMPRRPIAPMPLGHDELLREMDGAGVSRCILVPPTWEADRNDTSLEAARLHPDRFRVMGKLALTNPNGPALMADLETTTVHVGYPHGFQSRPVGAVVERWHRRLVLGCR